MTGVLTTHAADATTASGAPAVRALGLHELRELVPHAHPMLLVDRVVAIDDAVGGANRIVTEKAVSGSEPCFGGLPAHLDPTAMHYPTSLLMESWGQGAAVLWVERLRALGEDPGALILAAVHGVRFHRPVVPGDVLRHEVRLERFLGTSIVLSGTSHVGGESVLTVEQAIAVMVPPADDRTSSTEQSR